MYKVLPWPPLQDRYTKLSDYHICIVQNNQILRFLQDASCRIGDFCKVGY